MELYLQFPICFHGMHSGFPNSLKYFLFLTPRLTFSNPKATLYFPFLTITVCYIFCTSQIPRWQAYTTRSRAPTITSPHLAANCLYQNNARFEVLTAFWHVTTCRLVNSYQRFGVAQCLHLQRPLDEIVLSHILNKRPWQPSRGLSYSLHDIHRT